MKTCFIFLLLAITASAQTSAKDSTPWEKEPSSFLGLKFHQSVEVSYSHCPDDPGDLFDPNAEQDQTEALNESRVQEARINSASGYTMSSSAAARALADLHTYEYNVQMSTLNSRKASLLADEYLNPGIDGLSKVADGNPCFYRFDKIEPGRFSIENMKSLNVHGVEIEGKVEFVIAAFDTRISDQVLHALIDKFGQPTKSGSERIQTLAGVKYDRQSIIWSGKNVSIVFRSLSENIEVGSVTAITTEFVQKSKHDESEKSKDIGKSF